MKYHLKDAHKFSYNRSFMKIPKEFQLTLQKQIETLR